MIIKMIIIIIISENLNLVNVFILQTLHFFIYAVDFKKGLIYVEFMEQNLTSGNVLKNIAHFSLPYVMSYFLQTLYGLADLYIIGQFDGVAEITAVSVGSQIMHMLTVMIVGLAMGSTVVIARAVGAKQNEKAAKAITNTAFLFMGVAVVLTGLLLFFVKPIVSVMATPTEAVAGTITYLTVCFLGIPFITAYNVISSVFRGLGDSKSPMYFITVACIANIILDYLFIGYFDMGTLGAALGTTLSQAISVIFSLVFILKKKIGIKIAKGDFKLYPEIFKQVLRIGVPISLQDGFIQIAFIVITIIANMRGLNDAAAVGIVEKIIGLVFLIPSSMLSTVSAISAQCIGAKKHKRASITLFYGTAICVIYGIIMVGIVEFFSEPIVGLFMKEKSQEVLILGGQYLRGYIWDCIFAGIHFCFSGFFCAYGKSEISFIHNFLSIVCVRVPGSYFGSKYFATTLFPMGLAAPLGSLLSVMICLFAYVWLKKRIIVNMKN